MKKTFNNAQGFSLLEVLITILLTTVGILGMVAMQGRAIQYTQDSVQRTHAVILANELMEIVRTNPGSLENLGSNEDAPLFEQLAASSGDCVSIDNSSNEVMHQQIACWAGKVRRLLPGAEDLASNFYACISDTPGNCDNKGAALEVQLAWQAVGENCLKEDSTDNPDVCVYRLRSQI